MPVRKQPSITVPEDARKHAVAALRAYCGEHMDAEVGDLKAGLLFDFILAELGPTIYNQAIADARVFFEDRVADLAGICYHEEFPSTVKRKR